MFDDNDALRDQFMDLAGIYVAQPQRERCKICDTVLPSREFEKHGVPYTFCVSCGHLNGLHEDTQAFCEAVYTRSGASESYKSLYTSADESAYAKRVEAIYQPKVVFMAEALREDGVDPANLIFADIGAGSGYFVSALRKLGYANSKGYEVSSAQVALAGRIDPTLVQQISLDSSEAVLVDLHADVVSLIGVLEHVREPRKMVETLIANARVRYLYLSVPLFSPSVFVEMVFPDVMPRQLCGDHTHLFTVDSLRWLEKAYALRRVAAWWFGTDIVDLYRSFVVSLAKAGVGAPAIERWSALFSPMIDSLQVVIDRERHCSEVHLLLRVR